MSQEIGLLRLPVIPRRETRPVIVTEESSKLVIRANELAAEGDIVAAMYLDDCAMLLERGHSWDQMLDDVVVRAPFVN